MSSVPVFYMGYDSKVEKLLTQVRRNEIAIILLYMATTNPEICINK